MTNSKVQHDVHGNSKWQTLNLLLAALSRLYTAVRADLPQLWTRSFSQFFHRNSEDYRKGESNQKYFFYLPQVRFCPHKNRCLWANESEEYRNCLSSPLHLPTIKVLRLWRFQRETSWQSGCYLGYWYHLPGESVPILITFLPQRDFDGMKHHGM